MAVEISFWGDPTNQGRAIETMRKYGYQVITESPKPQSSQGFGRQRVYTPTKTRVTRITSDQMKNELDGLFESLKEYDQTEEEEGCPAVKSKLYKHQKQALAWMRSREGGGELPPFWEQRKPTQAQGQTVYHNTVTNFSTVVEPKRVKGGILADDMGLGKTLITISLILGNYWNEKPMHKLNSKNAGGVREINQVGAKKAESNDDVIIIGGTKLSFKGVMDDPAESDETRRRKKLRRRSRAKNQPRSYAEEPVIEIIDDDDVVVPSRSKRKKSEIEDGNGGGYIPSEQTGLGSLVGCTSDKRTPETRADSSLLFEKEPLPKSEPHMTLIVCPLSLIGNWVCQIEEHVHCGAEVRTLVYHGAVKSQVNRNTMSDRDVVITTYQTLAQELKKCETSLLLNTKWLRVVLDEGHIIRNPNTQTTKACRALKSERKWVLTGTPIQNSTKDLFSLISFLGIEPFTVAQWWRRTIQRPISDGDANALKRIRCLLGAVCMRRTKQQKINGKPIISMPAKTIYLQTIDLDRKEREMYNRMDKESKQAMKRYISDGLQSTHYADMLVFIMRLRQICCHPSLAKEALEALSAGVGITKEASKLATKLLCMLEAGSVDDCCICLDSFTMPVITKCAHVFCKLCICGVIANNIHNGTPSRCPLCRASVDEEDLVDPPMENDEREKEFVNSDQRSSKINALMYELLKMKKEKPEVKSLVVSQFTEYLKIIQAHLVANDISCVLYHGGLTRKFREAAIWQLQSGHAKVMLLTLKAGGVGLNLTAASQVFLMEPSWNPAAEDQCFDRVHRLGQDKPVRIVKFVCSDTVEEKMVQLQARKRELAKASLRRRSPEERKQQTVDDLRKLMDA